MVVVVVAVDCSSNLKHLPWAATTSKATMPRNVHSRRSSYWCIPMQSVSGKNHILSVFDAHTRAALSKP